ncbi:hypothetical protein EYF80_026909 [Liparis tanakae]|uniref:Uncharacterized protein n=1 Tax=Liparis tanakae TaxID=230148 RepID=A0A4Z2HD68_9TELE|nr:hypothetical protein EYF80_026909 [Liparis tanakae]
MCRALGWSRSGYNNNNNNRAPVQTAGLLHSFISSPAGGTPTMHPEHKAHQPPQDDRKMER